MFFFFSLSSGGWGKIKLVEKNNHTNVYLYLTGVKLLKKHNNVYLCNSVGTYFLFVPTGVNAFVFFCLSRGLVLSNGTFGLLEIVLRRRGRGDPEKNR